MTNLNHYANVITNTLERNLTWGYDEDLLLHRTQQLAESIHETFLRREKDVDVEDIKDFIIQQWGDYEDEYVQRYNATVVRYLYEHMDAGKMELRDDFLSYHDSFLFDVHDILTDIEKKFIDDVYNYCTFYKLESEEDDE